MSENHSAFSRTASPAAVLAGLFFITALLPGRSGENLWPEVRIAAGFILFFVLPGVAFRLCFFPSHRFHPLELFPLSIALSFGVWAVPGLSAYTWSLSLEAVTVMELAILGALLALAFLRSLFFPQLSEPDPRTLASPGNTAAILAVTLALAALAAFTGSLRGPGLDWDHFNYISAVKKLLVWDRASIAHFAYRDAPPDPIHSYNLLALEWAVIGRLFHLDPIDMYVRSAFLTVPAAGLAFYSLGLRLFSANTSRTAFFLYAAYHVIYGGLAILGMSTFYPDDSQWLISFPASLALFLSLLDSQTRGCSSRTGLFLGLALSALGVAVIHVLWGLAFYLSLAAFALLLGLYRQGAARAVWGALRGGKAAAVVGLSAWALLPLILMTADTIVMARRGTEDGRSPLFGAWADLPPWMYFLGFVVLPAFLLGWVVFRFRPRDTGRENFFLLGSLVRTVAVIGGCLTFSLPYIYLRHQAIHVTNWSLFGINPYRAFLSSTWFFLNPFQRSLSDPTMTFFPLYVLGYLALPALVWRGRKDPVPRLALAVLVAVPLICFHPCLATIFAQYFSQGYLRRLLKLAALFSFFPLAILLHRGLNLLFDENRRPLLHLSAGLLVSALLALACIPFTAEPGYFNRLFRKTWETAKTIPKSTLTYEAEPYLVMAREGWFKPWDVIFSDPWTSFRLTAYLPCFVAVQHKPGTGVPDQMERERLYLDFFDGRTSPERMRQILDRFHAAGVIINRNPSYVLYNIPCGHPETIARLKQDPSHFRLLYDRGNWAVFRYTP